MAPSTWRLKSADLHKQLPSSPRSLQARRKSQCHVELATVSFTQVLGRPQAEQPVAGGLPASLVAYQPAASLCAPKLDPDRPSHRPPSRLDTERCVRVTEREFNPLLGGPSWRNAQQAAGRQAALAESYCWIKR